MISINDAANSHISEDILPEPVLDELFLLARGDVDMMEVAIVESLEEKRFGWFWLKKRWTIDIQKVIKKIIERRDLIDNLELEDHESQINT